MRSRWFFKIGRMLPIIAAAVLALGFIFMQLWNALIPDLFGGPVLGYFQAIGLLLLSQFIFRGGGGRRFGGWLRGDHWRKRFEERMATMTPEEREKLKERWGRDCGWDRGHSTTEAQHP